MTMLTLTILITILKNPAASAWTAYACTGSRAQQLLEEPYPYRA